MNRSAGIAILLVALATAAAVLIASRTIWKPNDSLPSQAAAMSKPNTAPGYGQLNGYGMTKPADIIFSDDAQSNAETQVELSDLDLVDRSLNTVSLSDIQAGRNLLLVVLRGAPLCPFCTAQTSRLKNNYDKFTELGCEVAVVFPGTTTDLDQLLNQALSEGQELPFPILVDTQLNTIRKLAIEGDKALPSTFVIDRWGNTQFAYVGASRSDRPSIKSLLRVLERLQPEAAAVTPDTAAPPANNNL